MSAADDVLVVAADLNAAPLLAALHAEAIAGEGETWSAEAFAELLAMPGAVAWLAEVPGPAGSENLARQAAGFVLARSGGGECEIIYIGVNPDNRRRGVGGRLLTTVLEAALGVQTPVILEVAADNPAARSLYARAGFRQVGRRRNYYRRASAQIDALILRWDGQKTAS